MRLYRLILFGLLLTSLTATAQINPRLLTAIRQNDPRVVEAALRAGANPNSTDSLGATPLMWACYLADSAVVQTLVKQGAKTECRGVIRTDSSTYYGNLTGLAAGLNKLPLLRYLLETLKLPINEPEYNPATRQNDGWTPAEWAAAHGHVAVLTYLADRGANLSVGKGNPMALAVISSQSATVGFLLERGLTLPKHHPRYERIVKNYFNQLLSVSQIAWKKGHHVLATISYEQLCPLYADLVGKQDAYYATLLNNLAGLYERTGQFEKAISLYQQCQQIQEKVLGSDHPGYAAVLSNLANLYNNVGQYEKALPLYQQCLQIQEKTLGTNNPNYATMLGGLASLYKDMGQFEKALSLYQQCLRIKEKVSGSDHPGYAFTLKDLADLYKKMGQYEKALLLYEQCLKIQDKALGKDHPDYATSLNNLAVSYESMGQHEKALLLYQQGLAITEKVLGKDHPNYAITVNNIAVFYRRLGQFKKALPFVMAARQQYKAQLLQTIVVLNESALANLQTKVGSPDFAYSIGYVSRAAALMGQHYNDALLGKGVGLLATQQLNNLLIKTTDSTTTQIARQMRQTKQRINTQLTLPRARQQGLDSLQRQAEALEQTLVLRLPAYGQAFSALRVEWPQVQQALKANEAAIEFVHFQYFHKKWTDSTFYAALVLRPGWAIPRMVFLCEQRQLDSLLTSTERREAYVAQLYGETGRGAGAEASGKPRRSLYSLVWQPIDSLLQGVNRIYYSPSGLLHRLNLGAIATAPRQRLANKYGLTLLSSTRQLALPAGSAPVYSKHALLLGNIRYDLDSTAFRAANASYRLAAETEGVASRAINSRGGSAWKSLDETGPEVDTAARLLTQAGYVADTLTGLGASEEGFYHYVRSGPLAPRFIHLATHGYFQDTPQRPANTDREQTPVYTQSDNPLVRSGLVLAGGNHVWLGGSPLAGQTDGILTAYEISLLDLSQTELVVLSACETGLGQVKGSEGVYGLQRAFKMAGVKNLIMSLWQVPDVATSQLMQSFYGYHLRDKLAIRPAFDKAVADLQKQYGTPYFWAGFVLVE